MAGLYIHIPFCKQACFYCNFHFTTSKKSISNTVDAIIIELISRKNYLNSNKIDTIYFGGGTPSVLNNNDIDKIFNAIYKHYEISENAEVSFECNPDDLTTEKINFLNKTPINRLSIGIQSFNDKDLEYLNRSHNANNAIRSIENSKKYFNNITIDLIYGIPTLSSNDWKNNLNMINKLDIPHFSAYCLTVEPQTPLFIFIKNNKIKPIDENLGIENFKQVIEFAKLNNFVHYEISNFSKENYFSKHNLGYWQNKNYVGIGAGAHSYNGNSRQWNIANNSEYVMKIKNNELYYEVENLSVIENYNEYVFTSLRTIWGCDKNYINNNFGEKFLNYFENQALRHIKSENIALQNTNYILTEKGLFLADNITSDLFYIE